MRRSKLLSMGLAALLVIALAGCSKQGPPELEEPVEHIPTAAELADSLATETAVYYRTGNGLLAPVARQIYGGENLAQAALDQLVAGEITSAQVQELGLNPTIPEGVAVTATQVGSTVVVDFSGELALEDAAQENAMVQSVAATLLALEDVSKVRMTFDGQSGDKLAHGTDVSGEFTAVTLNPELTAGVDEEAAQSVMVYFEEDSHRALVPVTRKVGGAADVREALEQLVAGPNEGTGLSRILPEDTAINSCALEGGKLTVDFTEPFANLTRYPITEQQAFKSLLLTLKQFPEIKQVAITVEGEPYQPASADSLSVPTFANEY